MTFTEMDKETTSPGTIEDEYLEVLATQASRVPLPVFLISIVSASMASSHYPLTVWGVWLAIVCAVLALRWWVLPRLPQKKHVSINRRILICILLSLLNGLVHASSVAFFADFTITEKNILTLLLIGLITGSVATTAGHMKIFLAFTIPVLGALIVAWITFRTTETNNWIAFGIPAILLVGGLLLTGLAKEYSRFFRESFNIRAEQKDLNSRLQQALNEAIDANKAKTRFFASASHDLRQPIHALSLFSASLSMRNLDGDTREIVSHMDTAIDNLATQMNALLDVSKLDAGLIPVNNLPFDVRKLLDNLEIEFQQQAVEKGLTLQVTGEASAFVLSDQELIDRILRNLVANAIRYTENGRVEIILAASGDNWLIRVEDTGCGIAAGKQKLVFEEFYQVDNPHRNIKQGLGLGLSIVKRLTEMLDIKISLQSVEGSGTSFCLEIPRYAGVLSGARPVALAGSIEGVKVLFVDDEPEIRFAMKTALQQQGCLVHAVEGTSEAVAALSTFVPDILVSDLRLSFDDNGLATIEKIREVLPGLPSLLITGDTAPERLEIASTSGIPLLHKPIKADVLAYEIFSLVTPTE